MVQRALVFAAGFLASCLCLNAQQRYGAVQPDRFALDSFGQGAANPAFVSRAIFSQIDPSMSPWMSLSDGRLFSFSNALNWMTPLPEQLPAADLPSPQRVSASAVPARDSSKKLAELRPHFDYATGEVGFVYGQSSGKWGREYKQGYVIGEVGNDRTQIFVGAAYEETSGRVPRFGR